MHIYQVILAVALVFPLLGHAQAVQTNEALRAIKDEDQKDRQIKPVDWTVVKPRDQARQKAVLEILNQGNVRTAEDFFNAALVFQHGDRLDDIRLAYSLANTAAAMSADALITKSAKWLAAAAWDRQLVRLKRPQWYGTQYTRSAQSGQYELYEVDETAVTDEERAANGVPSLAEARKNAARFN